MDAILVSVDYGDYLSICLPYNRRHFNRVMIVTTPDDAITQQLAKQHDCQLYITKCFYEDGGLFNKYRALEAGLDAFMPQDWLAIMDSDVLWPKAIDNTQYQIGKLYSPLRRMCNNTNHVSPESEWSNYPYHSLHNSPTWKDHCSGYTQILHVGDIVLRSKPWHRLDLPTAQGGDTHFQDKWKVENRIRPNWECLHLGPPRQNWSGRVSPPVKFD
jgi:hypothetical protein